MSDYDEVKYWNERSVPTSGDEAYTKAHIKFIRGEIKDHIPIMLDFGPGVGRMFPAYDGLVRDVVGYDISTLYSDALIEKAKSYDFHFGLVTAKRIKELPFEDFLLLQLDKQIWENLVSQEVGFSEFSFPPTPDPFFYIPPNPLLLMG